MILGAGWHDLCFESSQLTSVSSPVNFDFGASDLGEFLPLSPDNPMKSTDSKHKYTCSC